MYIVRRRYRALIIEHDYCNQSQAIAVAIAADRTNAWEHIVVIDQQTGETIVELGTTNKVVSNAKDVKKR